MRLVSCTLLLLGLFTALPAVSDPLSVCTEASPEGFDVVQFNSLTTTNAAADMLMNRLLDFDPGRGELVPSLARSWDVSADGREYRFQLREGVQFHHTAYFQPSRPLNAEDVLFSFRRMLDPQHPWHPMAKSGYPHAQAMQWPSLIEAIDAPTPMSLRIRLSRPDATFLATLSMGFASIYSAEYAAQLLAAGTPNRLNSQPIGTGPFILKRYQKDAVVRYLAHPEYFAGPAKAERVIFAITPDSKVRLQRLRRGECHIALSPKPLDVLAAARDPQLTRLSTPAFMTAFLAINSQHPPLDQVEVRQAINLAFDRNSYLQAVFENSASPARAPYPPNTWSFDASQADYPHDPAQARALLKNAGLADGFKLTLWTRPSSSLLNPNPSLGAQLLQADLAEVGIQAEIRIIEWGELIRRAKAGEHDLLFMGWAGDNGDPDNFLTPQFSCAALASGTNFARYCEPTLDRLISAGKQDSDPAQRSRIYQQAQQRIHNQALWVPLAHPDVSVLLRQGIEGYQVSPFGRQDFTQVAPPPRS